jgi:hypothetical protein
MNKLLAFLLLLLGSGAALADPISAIVAIGTMVGAAGAAGAATGAATVGLAGAIGAMTLTQGMMFAGGAISLIGNATKNKKLMNFGNILGIAGGVGELGKGLLASANTSGLLAEEGVKAAAPAVADAAGAAETVPAVQNPMRGVESAAAKAAAAGKTAQNASLLDNMVDGLKGTGKWVNDNKELVKLGSGIIEGAAKNYAQQNELDQQEAYLDRRRREYSDSVKGMAPVPDMFDPNADPTAGRPVQNPVRYVPQQPAVPPPAAQPQSRVVTPNRYRVGG